MPVNRLKLSNDALFQEIGGEAVILDLASSTYFGLNEVGARFWQLLVLDSDVKLAQETLLEEYDVSADELARDIGTLMNQLVDSGLASFD
jgi:hypothetical protein